MATKSLGQLTLDLIARIGGYTAPMDQAARKSKETGKKIKDSAKEASDSWSSLGKVVAGAFVGVSVGALYTRFIQETMAAEKEQAQLAAVLKSTGEAAGYSQDELNKMADSLEGITTFSGGEFTEAQTALLAFTGIVGDQVPRALKAAADMAARTGNSVKGSAELIGRALDVPSKGMAALSKQGFRFSDDQKKLIERLEQTGRTAEAQGIILNALEETYGGAAEAARNTFGGALQALNNTIDGLLTGEGSLDSAREAVERLNAALSGDAAKEGIDSLIAGFARLSEGGVGLISEFGNLGQQIAFGLASITGNVSELDKVEQEIREIDRALSGGLSTPVKYLFTSDEELKILKQEKQEILDALAGIDSYQKSGTTQGASSGSGLFEEYNNAEIEKEINKQLEGRIKLQKSLYADIEKIQSAYESQEKNYLRQIELTGEVTEAQRLQFELAHGSLVGINAQQQKRLEGMAKQIDAAKQLAENEKGVLELRKEFSAIHEQALEAEGNLIDLEKFRSDKQREALEKQMEELKAKGAWTAELEAEAQTALEEQEQAHQDRLKKIREQADLDELKRRQIQLQGAESLFSALGDLTDAFGEKNSRARKAFLIAEKAASIAQASIAIYTGILEASKLGFPQNLAAMGTVATATAGVFSDLKGVNIAHGGLTYVPEETTYLLDQGERVVSPRQNEDLTSFLANAKVGNSAGVQIEVINQMSTAIDVRGEVDDDGRIRLIINAVKNDLRKDLNNGAGIWREAKERYNWTQKGKI